MRATEDSSRYAELDRIDRSILLELERDGRISNTELAARVGIAESTCHKRTRALVATGAIAGFRADVDPAALGLHLEALISIRLQAHARGNLRDFQRELGALSATRRVYFLAGDHDFLVHVAVADAQELRELVADTISVREEVAATTTSVIFDHTDRRSQPPGRSPAKRLR